MPKRRVKNKLLWMGGAVSGAVSGALLYGLGRSRRASRTSVIFASPALIAAHIDDPDLRILDTRDDPGAYLAGHLPGAVHFPAGALLGPARGLPGQLLPTALLARLFERAGVRDGMSVLVYADSAGLFGAALVAYALERLGQGRVALLDGGYEAHLRLQPAEKTYPSYAPYGLTVHEDTSMVARLVDVAHAARTGAATLIDARPVSAYAGEENGLRRGHIPGALNLEARLLTEPHDPHALASRRAVERLAAEHGILPGREIIVYGCTCRDAALVYLVLRHLLSYPRVRLYEGSWVEYEARGDEPVERGASRARAA